MEELFRQYAPLVASSLPRGNDRRLEWRPVADISETDREYLIKVELPDVRKEDVKITLDNEMITISGERKQIDKQQGENDIRVESFYGAFSRSFLLPDNVDTSNVRAEAKDGILRVHIPKAEPRKSQPVSVEVH
jgi:HSP20 family protein